MIPLNKSKFIAEGNTNQIRSRLIKSALAGIENLKNYEIKPQGVFGAEATVICGAVTVKSSELDLEFTVMFDDDMEANEAEIIIYNLSDDTKNKFTQGSEISIEAGFKGDTGVIFKGYITKVKTKYEDADRVTTIKCLDDIKDHTITEITYGAGTAASTILNDLLKKTGTPIKEFKMYRDWNYKDEVKVDGDLMENIKKYSEVCGVSTYVSNGYIYSRRLNEGDNLYFTLSEETGLIGTPEEYEEEKTAEDYKDVINGYECECLLQHRFAAGGIVTLISRDANGTFRICSGEHRFNPDECISKIKMY